MKCSNSKFSCACWLYHNNGLLGSCRDGIMRTHCCAIFHHTHGDKCTLPIKKCMWFFIMTLLQGASCLTRGFSPSQCGRSALTATRAACREACFKPAIRWLHCRMNGSESVEYIESIRCFQSYVWFTHYSVLGQNQRLYRTAPCKP